MEDPRERLSLPREEAGSSYSCSGHHRLGVSGEASGGSGNKCTGPQAQRLCHSAVVRTWTGHFTSEPWGLRYGKVLDQMTSRVPLRFYHSTLRHRSFVQGGDSERDRDEDASGINTNK